MIRYRKRLFTSLSGIKATGFKTLWDGDRGTFDKEQVKKDFDATHGTVVVD